MIDTILFSLLPFDIIREILLYDQHFVIRKHNNRLICINKIPKIDKRFFYIIQFQKYMNYHIIVGKLFLEKKKKICFMSPFKTITRMGI